MNVSLPPIHPDDLCILDACAGFGMLGEAVLLGLEALGLKGRVVCHVERDAAAAAALVARMAGSPMDQAPVCDTLRSFDTRPWRGLVDILCAGLPCQPYSLAGKRAGNSDRRSWGRKKSHRHRPRGPVAEFLRIVRDLRPAMVLLENVPAWVVGGHFRSVGEELCRLGYTIEDPIFLAAGDVKAPHERERVFILCHLADAASRRGRLWETWHRARRSDVAGTGDCVAYGAGQRCNGRAQCHQQPNESAERAPRRRDVERCDAQLGDAGSESVEWLTREFPEAQTGRGGSRDTDGRRVNRPSVPSGRMDNAAGPRCDGARSGTSADGSSGQRLSREGIPDVGDAERETGACVSDPPQRQQERRTSAQRAGQPVGDASESARRTGESQSPGIERRGARHLQGCCELPLFPPGRGDIDNPDHPDWSAWAAVAEMEPANMPRVEPELSMVADGLAFARADLLRIGGNGVVPVAAAVAFAHLLVAAIKRIGGAA